MIGAIAPFQALNHFARSAEFKTRSLRLFARSAEFRMRSLRLFARSAEFRMRSLKLFARSAEFKTRSLRLFSRSAEFRVRSLNHFARSAEFRVRSRASQNLGRGNRSFLEALPSWSLVASRNCIIWWSSPIMSYRVLVPANDSRTSQHRRADHRA